MVFDGIYRRGDVAQATSGEAWLQALLDVEAALAQVHASRRRIPPGAAERITAACRAERFDLAQLTRESAAHATVVVPLVRALRAEVGLDDAAFVHVGATSQDVLDTAAMLVATRALVPLLADARQASAAASALAARHRSTAMIGRTLLQQALPTTFGLRAAGWTVALDDVIAALERIRSRRLAVQLGGPVGTGDPSLAASLAARLGLSEPVVPWHVDRVRIAELAGALGALSGVLGKIARDVTLHAQQEVGELRESGGADRGGSSAIGHKRNPVAAVSTLACTRRVPGLLATAFAGMEQEHERAAGSWQAEWGTVAELLELTGSAAAWGRELLEGLEVDHDRMWGNLDRLQQAVGAEAAGPDREQVGILVDRALAAHASAAGPPLLSSSSAVDARAAAGAGPARDAAAAPARPTRRTTRRGRR